MTETKDQQVRTVVEGLALGVLAHGVRSVPHDKMRLEFALSHAWRKWERSGQFPSIGRAIKIDNLLWGGMMRSDRSQALWGAWEMERRAYPYLRQEDWTPSDGLELLADSRASEDDWRRLAEYFLEYFDEDEIEPTRS